MTSQLTVRAFQDRAPTDWPQNKQCMRRLCTGCTPTLTEEGRPCFSQLYGNESVAFLNFLIRLCLLQLGGRDDDEVFGLHFVGATFANVLLASVLVSRTAVVLRCVWVVFFLRYCISHLILMLRC